MDEAIKIYFDPKHWAGLGSLKTLEKAISKKVDLTKYRGYTIHRPARKRMSMYRPYRAAAYGYQLQADLNDMISLKHSNNGYQYILTVIDIFTRYAWALPLKTKHGEAVTRAFKTIFKEVSPIYLQTDSGKEFYNSEFRNLLDSKKIKLFSVYSPHKAAIVERFNRTLKGKMFRYFTHNNTENWVDILPDLIKAYTGKPHSSLPNKLSPKEAKKSKYGWLIWSSRKLGVIKKTTLKTGDFVRISKVKAQFAKGYKGNWSEQIYTISSIDKKEAPVMYHIKDYKNEIIVGKFYRQELQLVSPPDNYPIEKIFKRKKGKYLVKFLGYPEEYWVENIINNVK